MLKDLLREIKNSKYFSQENLAVKLNKPLGLIEDGFQQLIRMGYIEKEDSLVECEAPCGSCPYAKVCSKMPVNTIKITKKGEKLLNS